MTSREDAQLDDLIASLTIGAKDDAATVAAFAREIMAALKVPTLGLVLGERVQVEGVELPSPRRGIVALLRKGGRSRNASLLDAVIPGRSRGALLVRAYQRWAGVTATEHADAETAPAVESTIPDIIEAVVLKVASETARLRPLGEDQEITLRGSGYDLWKVVPGQIVSVKTSKRWMHRRYQYASGAIEAARIDVAAIGLKPLALHQRGPIDAADGYDDDLRDLRTKVAAHGNVAYELERIVPGAAERGDPVLEALDLRGDGDNEGAEKILMRLLHADLRCIAAHGLLGAWSFENQHDFLASRSLPHFEVAVGIGEHALGAAFDDRLPWAFVGNRSFLRCLLGYGLALWRFGRSEEATKVFERFCALNPSDELDARSCWKAVRDGVRWADWSSRP